MNQHSEVFIICQTRMYLLYQNIITSKFHWTLLKYSADIAENSFFFVEADTIFQWQLRLIVILRSKEQ